MHFQESRLKFGTGCKREIRVSDKNRKRLKIIFFFPRRYFANSKYKQKNVLRDKILIVIFEIVIKISIIKINFTNEFVYIWKNIGHDDLYR